MTKNEIQVFENTDFGNVRVVEYNGEPYFVGKDVAEILGYSNATTTTHDTPGTISRDKSPSLRAMARREKEGKPA